MSELFRYVAGMAFLGMAKARHKMQGYTSPKPFSVDEVDRCIDYDLHVVNEWRGHLANYNGRDFSGAHVLELGPGSDLGVGLALLAAGARRYTAVDRHDLAARVPDAFYRRMREREAGIPDLQQVRSSGALNYVVREDFDIEQAVPARDVDLVVSNAAFEHFDDVPATVARLTRVTRPGAVIAAVVDLQTHSRWIREVDPNNIYRYSPGLYRLFRFHGIPNRVRPHEYQAAFEQNGWRNIQLQPLNQFDSRGRGVARRFRDPQNKMDWLSFVICATRA